MRCKINLVTNFLFSIATKKLTEVPFDNSYFVRLHKLENLSKEHRIYLRDCFLIR